MDRSRDPFDLLEELERELGIETYAMNWPIGSGKEFQGVYDRQGSQLLSSPPAPPEKPAASRRSTCTAPRSRRFWGSRSTGN